MNLCELFGGELKTDAPVIRITARDAEHETIQTVLRDFVENPLAYNLSEMCGEDEMREMAGICKNLVNELYG